MDNDNHLQTNGPIDEDVQTINSIYRQISIEFNDNYDEVNESRFLLKLLNFHFNYEFKSIDSNLLIKDVTLFNNKFASYVKFCLLNNYKKITMIFLTFCDYFNLPYNKMFESLQVKLKQAIINRYIKTVGTVEYSRQKQRYEEQKDYVQPTLFDLLSQK